MPATTSPRAGDERLVCEVVSDATKRQHNDGEPFSETGAEYHATWCKPFAARFGITLPERGSKPSTADLSDADLAARIAAGASARIAAKSAPVAAQAAEPQADIIAALRALLDK